MHETSGKPAFEGSSLRRHTSRFLGAPEIGAIPVALAAAVFVIAVNGIAPFPSVDDYAYAPLALLDLDDSLYPADELLRGFSNHALAYSALFRWFSTTSIGVSTGFAWATGALAGATVLGILVVMWSLRAKGYLSAAVVASTALVWVRGVGRGQYGGIFGDAFQGQWLSLVILLFTLAAFLKGRSVLSGCLLSAAAYAHPMVGLHGAWILLCGGLLWGVDGLRSVLVVGATSVALAVPLAVHFFAFNSATPLPPPDATTLTILTDAYRFRAPHHYELVPLIVGVIGLYAFMGTMSLNELRSADSGRPVHRIAGGLLAGMTSLLIAAVLFYHSDGDTFGPRIGIATAMMDLTRTSPLLVCFSAILYFTAVERCGPHLRVIARGRTGWLTGAHAAFGLLLALNIHPVGWLLIAGSLLTAVLARGRLKRVAISGWTILGVLTTVVVVSSVQVDARVEPEASELYEWARDETDRDALFIAPPSMEAFRYFARRSLYTDFKLISMAQPSQAWLARKRLEVIAAPDPETSTARGWEGLSQWDLSYARRNDPERVSWLLTETGADYFIADLRLTPQDHLAPVRIRTAGLDLYFRNSAYIVLGR